MTNAGVRVYRCSRGLGLIFLAMSAVAGSIALLAILSPPSLPRWVKRYDPVASACTAFSLFALGIIYLRHIYAVIDDSCLSLDWNAVWQPNVLLWEEMLSVAVKRYKLVISYANAPGKVRKWRIPINMLAAKDRKAFVEDVIAMFEKTRPQQLPHSVEQ